MLIAISCMALRDRHAAEQQVGLRLGPEGLRASQGGGDGLVTRSSTDEHG